MKKQKRIVINGFGRIGRAVFKILVDNPLVKVVAVNDLSPVNILSHLLKYDSVYGRYEREVKVKGNNFEVDGNLYQLLAEPNPLELPWGKLGVDVVLECTGRFVADGSARAHIKAGAKKVILSAPAKGKGRVPTYLIGVNEDKYKGEDLLSCASCTTNSIGVVTKLIQDNFKIKQAFLTTVHSYTAGQNLVDGSNKDLRRARAAGCNIVPTTTGAAISLTEVMPKLKNKFDGLALRVPTICGSISDLTYIVGKNATVDSVNSMFIKMAKVKRYKNILGIAHDPLVSTDIIKSNYSAVIDLGCTRVLNKNMVKIMAWYDNEWGYSNRLVELALLV